MRFNEDDKVNTPKGTGKVVYADEGYIAVRLSNGVEMEFSHPFKSVTPYVEVTPEMREMKAAEEYAKELILLFQSSSKGKLLLENMKAFHQAFASVAENFGKAHPWDELYPAQKIAFLSVATQIEARHWRLAHAVNPDTFYDLIDRANKTLAQLTKSANKQ